MHVSAGGGDEEKAQLEKDAARATISSAKMSGWALIISVISLIVAITAICLKL